MKLTTIFRALPGIIVMALGTACLASTILDTTTAITQSDPIQMGRISRNGVQQDWIGTESFGGTIYTDQVFHYHTYTIPSAALTQGGQFVQVSFDDLGLNQGNLFVSAYANSYNPASIGTTWLGDAGQSGNFLDGTSPAYFQVLVPPGASLVLVVWNAGFDNLGVGEQFRLIAEQFTDVAYSEPTLRPALPTINVQASTSQVREGNKAVLTFTASPTPVQTTTVNYSTGNSAVMGKDYILSGKAGRVVFSAGQTSATVTLKAIQDKDRVNETATITIQSGNSYLIGPNNSASIAILER